MSLATELDALRRVTPPGQALNAETATTWQLTSGQEVLLGRDPLRCQVHLPHPSVSRAHARIKMRGGSAILVSISAANPVYVEGRPLQLPLMLRGGERITVGPFDLFFQPPLLTTALRCEEVPILARGLRVERGTGRAPLLRDIDLAVPKGRLACIIGPSGCGKSTLLHVLGGRRHPLSGAVWINRRDLRTHFASLQHDLAVVPQYRFFHESLTPRDTLTYTARLRMSADLRGAEIQSLVERALTQVGIEDRGDVRLCRLSGGQRKRVSLANELLADPSVLLLDEVTSGLDELADAEIMELLQRLAQQGKTLLCVTHNTSNIERYADLVVTLADGGHLAFLGDASETCDYFKIERLADVYRRLAEREALHWHGAFRGQSACATHLARHLAAAPDQIVYKSPRQSRVSNGRDFHLQRCGRQIATVLARSAHLAVNDWRGTAVLAAQSVFIGLMIAAVFPRLAEGPPGATSSQSVLDTCHVLFLLAVACYWLGCSYASKEIVREQSLWHAERLAGLAPAAYLAAKLAWVLAIGAAQATLLFAMVRWRCFEIGAPVEQWLVCVASAGAGSAMGLAISAAARKESVAVGLVPIVLLPQIIFAGVLRVITGWQLALAQGSVSVYWTYAALRHTLPADFAAQLPIAGRALWISLSAVFIHGLACCALAWWRLSARDRAEE